MSAPTIRHTDELYMITIGVKSGAFRDHCWKHWAQPPHRRGQN